LAGESKRRFLGDPGTASGALDPAPSPQTNALRSRLDYRTLGLAAVHLTALSALAIAQPLFDLLGQSAAFFTLRQSTASEIVAFALLVVVAPPALLMLVQALAALIDPRARTAVHLLSVAGLVSMIALQALKRTGFGGAEMLGLAALLVGVAAAFAYARFQAARSLVTVLGAAPPLFLALFLFGSPVKELVLVPDEARVAMPTTTTKAPIVMVVFDEFPVGSLMDRDGRIDPVRYPNFAKLARGANWYRNTASVSPWTEEAVPAVLTGEYPRAGALPAYQDHPRNLFTLFGRSHDLRVYEPLTSLCPPRLCRRTGPSAIAPGLGPLLSDASIVYSHILLPRSVAIRAGLPDVTTSWGDFRKSVAGRRSPSAQFELFLHSLSVASRPTLYFLHVELPHSPFRYLPSGRQYLGRTEQPLVGAEPGQPDAWAARQAHQRHLLQVGFTDRLLGRLLARLRTNGLYDRSLVVVAADHGVAFLPGEPARAPTPTNAHEIVFVPFFVKAPGQNKGRIVDRPLETIDVLPTIAATVGVRLPWRVDGRSERAGKPREIVEIASLRFDPRPLASRRAASVAARIAAFGAHAGWGRALRIGPHVRLIGRRVADLPHMTQSVERARIEDEAAYTLVDPTSSFLPAYVGGRIDGGDAGRPLAVSVNGRIAGVTRTYRDGNRVRFYSIVPETAFRSGPNDIAVYAVVHGHGHMALRLLGKAGRSTSFALRKDAHGELLVSADGRTIRVRAGAVGGHVDRAELERDRVGFGGWAADLDARRVRDRVVVFADDRFVASFSATVERKDLGADIAGAGFSFVLPLSTLTRTSADPDVRVIAIVGDVASELTYPDDYPW